MRHTLLLTTAAIFMLGTAGAVSAAQDSAAQDAAGSSQQSQMPAAQSEAMDQAAGSEAGGQAGDLAGMQELLGRSVTGSDGQALGEISDIVLNQGTERANIAVIDTGAAEGGSDKLIAVDYTLLDVQEDKITVRDINRDQVAAMPAFEYSESMVSLGNKGGAKGDGTDKPAQ